MVWTPQYFKNRISGLFGEGDIENPRNSNGNIHFLIEVTYSYNDIGQIIQVILNYSAIIDSEDVSTSEKLKTTITTDYSYNEGSTYWESATMKGKRRQTTIRVQTPSGKQTSSMPNVTDLGTIRYKREFIDNSK
jgi:hypothetical protein